VLDESPRAAASIHVSCANPDRYHLDGPDVYSKESERQILAEKLKEPSSG
jgi:hypothetical protein